MDADLSRLKGVDDGDGFVAALERIMGDTLTEDYWEITLTLLCILRQFHEMKIFGMPFGDRRLYFYRSPD